jgi:hypothetical protein
VSSYPLGTYVWWRTPVPTPRWLDDEDFSRWGVGHPISRFFGWARSVGLIQIRPSAAGRALMEE